MLDGYAELLLMVNARTAPLRSHSTLPAELREAIAADVRFRFANLNPGNISMAPGFYPIGQLVARNFEPWRQISQDLVHQGTTAVLPSWQRHSGGFFAMPIYLQVGQGSDDVVRRAFERLTPEQRVDGLPISASVQRAIADAFGLHIDRVGLLDVVNFLAVPALFSSHVPVARLLLPRVYRREPATLQAPGGLDIVYDPGRVSSVCLLFDPPPIYRPSDQAWIERQHSDLLNTHKLLTGIYRIPTRVVRVGQAQFTALTPEQIRHRTISDYSVTQSNMGQSLPVGGRWVAVISANASLDAAIVDLGHAGPDQRFMLCERHLLLTFRAEERLMKSLRERARVAGSILRCCECSDDGYLQ